MDFPLLFLYQPNLTEFRFSVIFLLPSYSSAAVDDIIECVLLKPPRFSRRRVKGEAVECLVFYLHIRRVEACLDLLRLNKIKRLGQDKSCPYCNIGSISNVVRAGFILPSITCLCTNVCQPCGNTVPAMALDCYQTFTTSTTRRTSSAT